MQIQSRRPGGAIFLGCALALAAAGPARADAEDASLGPGHWRVTMAPLVWHFDPDPEHGDSWAIGVERQRSDNWLAGFSYFRNSFSQPSAYAYVGKRFPALWGQPRLFGQISAGLMYGYVEPYEDKVPLNHNGYSPGALFTLGWQFTPEVAAAVHLLGSAGLMLQLSYDLP